MKNIKKLISLVFTFSSLSLFSQTSIVEKYYKDYGKSKETKEEKANYKETIREFDDGLKQIEFVNMKTNKLLIQTSFKNNEPAGLWITYNEYTKETIERNFDKLIYSDDKIEDGKYFSTSPNDSTDFTPAKYKTEEEFFKYLGTHIRYPSEAKDSGAQGVVYVQVKIDKDGDLKVVSIYRGVDPYLDYEAFRVFDIMPDWTPAQSNGENIDSYSVIPVRFVLR